MTHSSFVYVKAMAYQQKELEEKSELNSEERESS